MENPVVREFLNRYERGGASCYEKSTRLCRFFEWLRVLKGLKMSPSEFLDEHLRKRGASSVAERPWELSLALEFSRDNPGLKDQVMQYKYSAWYLPSARYQCMKVLLIDAGSS